MGSKPTFEDWFNLYEQAVAFKQLAPWRWMLDSQVFAVQDPASGAMGYCVVMGALGEMFALGVYRGQRGLRSLLEIQTGQADADAAMLSQDCLMASFEDRSALGQPDLKVVRELGYRFRGRNEWPLFRSYVPNYAPWYLEQDEARFLAAALEQGAVVANSVLKDPNHLRGALAAAVLTRRQDAKGGWAEDWVVPEAAGGGVEAPPVDEVRLQRLRRASKPVSGPWELHRTPLPGIIEDGGRPYYIQAVLCMDLTQGVILGFELVKPDQGAGGAGDALLGIIEKHGVYPTTSNSDG